MCHFLAKNSKNQREIHSQYSIIWGKELKSRATSARK